MLPLNLVPLSVLKAAGVPKTASSRSLMTWATVLLDLSGMSCSTQNLLKQQIAANMCTLRDPGGPREVTKSSYQVCLGPGGKGSNLPYQLPWVLPPLS